MAQKKYNHYDDYDRPPVERRLTLKDHLRDLRDDVEAARKRREKRLLERRLAKEAEERAESERNAAREHEKEKERALRHAASERLRKENEAETSYVSQSNYGKNDPTAGNRVSDERIFPEERGKKRRAVEVTGRFPIYLALLAFAFIFTQALHGKASNIFMSFVFFLPFLLLAYVILARFFLRVEILSKDATVRKGEEYGYELLLVNQSILAYPFIEAEMLLPEANSVRTGERTVSLAMSPFGRYHVKNAVRFRFRGTYHIGVRCLYVYDFFRIFRVRVDVGSASTVLVLPRRMLLPDRQNEAISDEIDPTLCRSESAERVEVGDLRDYRAGDPLKSIHWNLSSRSEDLVVKDYVGGSTKQTYIYCDLSARFGAAPPSAAVLTRAEKRREKREGKRAARREDRKERFILKARERETDLSEEALLLLFEEKETKGERKRKATEEKRLERRLVRYARIRETSPRRAARLYGKIRVAEEKLRTKTAEEGSPYGILEEEAMLLVSEEAYEDMNEYCADGVIELAIASALRELRLGNEVVLIWYDDRSASGICAYSFRSSEELKPIYTLFATAPLVPKERFVGGLSALASDAMDVKEIFVTSAIDGEAVSRFSNMKTTSRGSEILLYDPVERFRYPEKRSVYVGGCREALLGNGIRLVTETPLDTLGKEADTGDRA